MNEKVVLSYAVQTSVGCPSQWDAWDAEGRYYYLRYRYGHGQARHYTSREWHWHDDLIAVVADFTFGHPLDGVISLEEFCEHAGIELAEDFRAVGYAEHFRDEMVQHGITELLDAPEEGEGR